MMRVNSAQELAVLLGDERKKQGLSQTDVGDSVGLKQATVSGFENRAGRSHIDTLFRLLAALNMELHVTTRDSSTKEDLEW